MLHISRELPPEERAGADASDHPKRRWARAAYWLRVTLYGPRTFVAGTVENLSEGGLFVKARHSFDVGTEVEFDLELPGGRVSVTGTVRWLRHYNPDQGIYPGIGLSFGELDEEQRRLICAALVIGSDRPEDEADTPV